MITPSFGLTATERVLPKLALDFTTAILDSRITFTRSLNTATRVNSSGNIETVNADVARFDYDPVTLACKGLLIEESRANLLTYSADLSNAVWIKSQASIDSTKVTAPDSTTSGQKLVEDTATANHLAYVGSLGLGSAIYTMSAYFKAAERTQAGLRLDTGVGIRQVIFDLSAVTATPSGGCTATIQFVGNGWYRCSITLSAAETLTNAVLTLALGGATVYAGDGTSGLYMWGIQLESGAFATSYIPTTTTSLTRNADVATMTGTNFSSWYNQTESAVSVQFTTNASAGALPFVAQVDNGTFNGTDRWAVYRESNNQLVLWRTINNVASSISSGISVTSGTLAKATAAVKNGSNGIAVNGNATATDAAGIPAGTMTTLRIGARGSDFFLNGVIAKLAFYPQRLINTEIQAFSK